MRLKNIYFELIKTTKRLTFDIIWQNPEFVNQIEDSRNFVFTASNNIEIISRSRMDIQTERLWLNGSSGSEQRSGSMVFSNNEKRDNAYLEFINALIEWDDYMNTEQGWKK